MTDTRVFDEALYQVLNMRRYDRLMGRTIDVRGWILDRLEWLLYRIFNRLNLADDTDFNVTALATIFGVAGILIAIAAAFIIIRSLIKNRRAKDYNLHEVFEELENRTYTVKELIALSDKMHEERFAVRYRYIAALLILGEKQVIKINASATNRLIEHQISTHAPLLVPTFTQIAHTFHLSWFGFKDIGKENFEAFAKSVDELADIESKPNL